MLLQLLQSGESRSPTILMLTLMMARPDEPDEVIVVKKALTEHLDMDPKVTLGVLCDQIAPPDEPMDEEEQSIRDRLRSLVLSFLTGEAKRAIVERHALPGSGAEETLINSLLVVRESLLLVGSDYQRNTGNTKIRFQRCPNHRQGSSSTIKRVQAAVNTRLHSPANSLGQGRSRSSSRHSIKRCHGITFCASVSWPGGFCRCRKTRGTRHSVAAVLL